MEHDSDYFPPVARALLDRTLGVPRAVSRIPELAACRRVTLYDATAGIIRYATPHERVREGVAPVDAFVLANPHVRFFVERNPGHADGEELACLAEVRLRDLARVVGRIAGARIFGRRVR
jgi:hypothetical protein